MIKIKLLTPLARLPVKAHPDDAGFDIYAAEDTIIPPRSRALISTGIAVALPKCPIKDHKYYLRIAPRSGLAVKSGIDVFAGVIDYTYRGECKVCLFNSSNEPFSILVGDRIAQMIPTVFLDTSLEQVDVLPEFGSRLDGGFGSTGKN